MWKTGVLKRVKQRMDRLYISLRRIPIVCDTHPYYKQISPALTLFSQSLHSKLSGDHPPLESNLYEFLEYFSKALRQWVGKIEVFGIEALPAIFLVFARITVNTCQGRYQPDWIISRIDEITANRLNNCPCDLPHYNVYYNTYQCVLGYKSQQIRADGIVSMCLMLMQSKLIQQKVQSLCACISRA